MYDNRTSGLLYAVLRGERLVLEELVIYRKLEKIRYKNIENVSPSCCITHLDIDDIDHTCTHA